jgi:hypothetical protein
VEDEEEGVLLNEECGKVEVALGSSTVHHSHQEENQEDRNHQEGQEEGGVPEGK